MRDRRVAGSRVRSRIDYLKVVTERQQTIARSTDVSVGGELAKHVGAFHGRRVMQVVALDTIAVLGLFGLTALAAPAIGDPAVSLSHPLPYLFAVLAVGAAAAQGDLKVRSRLPGAQLSRFGRLTVTAAVAAWMTALLAGVFFDVLPLGQLLAVSLLLPLGSIGTRMIVGRLGQVRAERVIILGTGQVAQRAAELLSRDKSSYDVIGIVDDDPLPNPFTEVIGSCDDLPRLLVQHQIDRVLVAFSSKPDQELMGLVRACDELAVDVDIVPRLFEFAGLEPSISAIGDLPIVHVRAERARLLPRAAKRAFDISVALLMILALSPILIAVAIAIWLEDRGPILYRQRRVGQLGRPFDILKFRSMVIDAENLDADVRDQVVAGEVGIAQAVAAIKNQPDPRVTRMGEFIRRTSMDELPQLWNVVRGEMSLVGPRPLRPFEVESLDAWQLVRQRVRPGLTGLWQVLGRSEIDWDDRMTLDYSYVRHWSPATDLRILADTLPVVLRGDGAR